MRQIRGCRSVRVLLVDHDQSSLKGMKARLRSATDIVVAGESRFGESAVQMALEIKPDLIVMDCLKRDRVPGNEAAKRIFAGHSEVKIIGVCDYDGDWKQIQKMFECGAAGVIEKSTLCDEIIPAIRAVTLGKTYIAISLGDTIKKCFILRTPLLSEEGLASLSPMQRQVHILTERGYTAKQIAKKKGTSIRTIESHRTQINFKLGRKSPVR